MTKEYREEIIKGMEGSIRSRTNKLDDTEIRSIALFCFKRTVSAVWADHVKLVRQIDIELENEFYRD